MIATKDEFFQGIRQWNTDERKLEFIENELAREMPVDVKITALASRAKIYLQKKWYNLAAQDFCNAASFASTFKEQTELYFNGALAYLLADEYLKADDAFRKVIILAPESEKEQLRKKIIILYLERAATHEQSRKYVKAISTYEKAINLNMDTGQKFILYDKLIGLYEKIGKPHEATQIREQKEAFKQQIKTD